MKKTYISFNSTQTQLIGKNLARAVLRKGRNDKAVLLLLKGDLGGGKTTFLKGFARGLGIKHKILSPTFIIMRKFSLNTLIFHSFYHLDCYRINSPADIKEIGLERILKDPFNIVAVEWPQKIISLLKKPYFEIKFFILSLRKRKIVIEYKK